MEQLDEPDMAAAWAELTNAMTEIIETPPDFHNATDAAEWMERLARRSAANAIAAWLAVRSVGALVRQAEQNEAEEQRASAGVQ